MTSTNWSSLIGNADTIDEKTERLLATISSAYCDAFPSKTVRIRPGDKPWMKPFLKALINQRDRAYAENKHLKYILLREKIQSTVLHLKKDYLMRTQVFSNTQGQADSVHGQEPKHNSSAGLPWRAIKKLLPLSSPAGNPFSTDDLNETVLCCVLQGQGQDFV
jgi:hypothetical protein